MAAEHHTLPVLLTVSPTAPARGMERGGGGDLPGSRATAAFQVKDTGGLG